MKQAMKRFGAILLTMAMLLSLAVTGVSAEEPTSGVKITFSGLDTSESSSDTLKAYQVIKYTDTSYNAFEDAKGVENGKTSFWSYLEKENNTLDDAEKKVNAAEYLASIKNQDTLRTLLQSFLSGTGDEGANALPSNPTQTSNGTLTSVEPGYYILQIESPSKIYNTMLLFVGYKNGELVVQMNNNDLSEENGAYKATVKSQDGPTVEKKVFDDRSGATATELENAANWKTAAASEVGKVVKFAVKVTLPTYPNDADVTLTLKDALKNMEYVANSVKVYKANEPHTEVSDAVTVNTQEYSNGEQSLDFTLNYGALKSATAVDAEFYVYYEATLREDAVSENTGDTTANHGGTNTAWMDYTVKTSTSDRHGESDKKTVTVYTYNFKLDKTYTGNGSMTGAEFSVYTGASETDVTGDAMSFAAFEGEDGKVLYYYPVDANAEGAVTSIPADFEIRGLDVSTKYYVKEVKTAPGYYLPTSYFTLELGGKEDATQADAKLLIGDLQYEDPTDYSKPSSFVAANKEADQALVQNGTESGGYKYGEIITATSYQYYVKLNNTNTPVLPSTGGMGTTLFTIGGVALLALAAAMLILRRRKN